MSPPRRKLCVVDRIAWAESASPTWSLTEGGRRPAVCWDDDVTAELGPDPDGQRLAALAERLKSGLYYPPEVIEFSGRFRLEGRPLQVGNRILQRAPLLPFASWPYVWSVAEVCVMEEEPDRFLFGYITTTRHLGRGIWRVEARRVEGRLILRVWSTAGPGSPLFWLGLPYARWLQLRARRRGIERCRTA
jgi:hypothetical protein